MTVLEWSESDTCLTIKGQRFSLGTSPESYLEGRSSAESLVLAKNRSMLERFEQLSRDHGPWRHIVDLGIYKGGSTAFLALAFEPERVSAFDWEAQPVEALEQVLDDRGLRDTVATFYGVDQADGDTLRTAVRQHHGEAALDCVIDDASHLYRQTRSSFETLFPLLRPGGVYVIEDWDWAHYADTGWQESGGYFHDRPALTNLIIELMMVLGTRPVSELMLPAAIDEIRVRSASVEVVRGTAPLSSPMVLEDHYLLRGLSFSPVL